MACGEDNVFSDVLRFTESILQSLYIQKGPTQLQPTFGTQAVHLSPCAVEVINMTAKELSSSATGLSLSEVHTCYMIDDSVDREVFAMNVHELVFGVYLRY